jgi:hypothetical protein
MKEGKFEKLKKEGEKIEVDIEISEQEEKEILEKYEDLEFLIEGIGTEYEELTEEEIEEGFESPPEGSPFILEPVNGFGLKIDDPEEKDKVKKVILKRTFELLGFDPENPKQIKEEKGVETAERGGINIKYFETKNPDLVLSFDGEDWFVEERKEEPQK